MKNIILSVLVILLGHSPSVLSDKDNSTTSSAAASKEMNIVEKPAVLDSKGRVVVFDLDEKIGSNGKELWISRKIHLRGEYGLMVYYAGSPDKKINILRYELYSKENKTVYTTHSNKSIKSLIKNLPPDSKLDFYNTCMGSGSTWTPPGLGRCEYNYAVVFDLMKFVKRNGFEVKYYVICTCFGIAGKHEWRFKYRFNSPFGKPPGCVKIDLEPDI